MMSTATSAATVDETAVPEVDVDRIREVLEYYWAKEWTDGLPVVPATESYVGRFLATVGRDPEEVLFTITHLNRHLTVRLAAINAAMAGCLPEYFPVVVAAWEAIAKEPHPARGGWSCIASICSIPPSATATSAARPGSSSSRTPTQADPARRRYRRPGHLSC